MKTSRNLMALASATLLPVAFAIFSARSFAFSVGQSG